MKLKAEEEIKTKLQLEAENGKMHYVNNNNKLQNVKPETLCIIVFFMLFVSLDMDGMSCPGDIYILITHNERN